MSTRTGRRWSNWGNYGRRTGGYSQWRNYWNRYSNRAQTRAVANRVSASQQRDSSDVVLNILHKASTFYLKARPGAGQNTFTLGVYAVNVYDLLRQSQFFESYANMYDQFKINSVQVKCTPVQWTGNSSNIGQLNGVTICTAWDRNGLDSQQLKDVEGGGQHTYYVTIGDNIGTYSSAYTKVLNPHSAFGTTRTIYPSTMQEKGQFIATSDLEPWYDQVNAKTNGYINIKEDKLRNNPCFLGKDPAVPFKPTFLLGIMGGLSKMSAATGAPAQGQYQLGNQQQDGNAGRTNESFGDVDFWGDVIQQNHDPVTHNITEAGHNILDLAQFNNEVVNLNGNQSLTSIAIPPIVFNLEFDVGVTFRGLRKAPVVDFRYNENAIQQHINGQTINPDILDRGVVDDLQKELDESSKINKSLMNRILELEYKLNNSGNVIPVKKELVDKGTQVSL